MQAIEVPCEAELATKVIYHPMVSKAFISFEFGKKKQSTPIQIAKNNIQIVLPRNENEFAGQLCSHYRCAIIISPLLAAV